MNNRLELLLKLHADSPTDEFTLFAIAKEFEGLGDLPKALGFYEILRFVNADYVGLYYHLGKLQEKLGNPEAALEAYDFGISVAKKARDMHAASELAGARMSLGDFDDDDEF